MRDLTAEEEERLRERWRGIGRLVIELLTWLGAGAGGVVWMPPPDQSGAAGDPEPERLRDVHR